MALGVCDYRLVDSTEYGDVLCFGPVAWTDEQLLDQYREELDELDRIAVKTLNAVGYGQTRH